MVCIVMEALVSLFCLLPVYALLHVLHFKNLLRSLSSFLFAYYLAVIYQLVGLPTVQFLTFDANLNLIPILPMAQDLKNTILNILLFIPLGFLLPLLWEKFRCLKATLLFSLGMTATIELAQLLTYRATDLNDVLTNLTGAMLGWTCFNLLRKIIPKPIPAVNQPHALSLILPTVLSVMFFIQPIVVTLIYSLT